MPSLGKLTAYLTADTSGLESGLRSSDSSLKRTGRNMGNVARRASMLGVAAAGAGAAILQSLVKRGLQAVDAQAKLARSLNGSIDGVRALQIAASDYGIDGMEASLARMNRRLGDAENAASPAARALAQLNLDARELAEMDVDDRLAAVADAVKESGLNAQETARLIQRLGFTQAEANAFFRDGGDAIRNAAQEVEDYGLSLNEVDAAKVEAANDALSRIGRLVEGIANDLAVTLSPILQGIADLWNDAARETGGFREQVEQAVNYGIEGGGKLADVLDGIYRLFTVLESGAVMMGSALRAEFLKVARAVIEGPTRAVNDLVNLANKLPGVSLDGFEMPEWSNAITGQIEQAAASANQAQEEIQHALNRPLVSETINDWVESARQKSQEAAEAAVGTKENEVRQIADIERGAIAASEERADEAMEREEQRRARNLDRLENFLATEAEKEIAAHEERMEWLDEARQEELVGEQDFQRIKEELEQKHQDALTDIERRGLSDREKFERASMSKRVSTAASALGQMTQDVARENKAMFNINKAAAIATATMEAIKGAEKTWNAYPYPFNIPMTAAHVASSAARLSQIKGASFSGGASSPSQGGGAISAPSQDSGQGTAQTTSSQRTAANINISGGDIFTGKQVRDLITSINDALDDGAVLRVN